MPHARRRGFTLVELLVVISIIALLIGILLPALGRARESAFRSVIASNLRSVGQAVATFNTENKDMMPNSYLYAASQNPNDTPRELQRGSADGTTNPYVHWSYRLLDGESAPAEAFTSPATESGGAPRTNPGGDLEDWDSNQVDNAGTPATNPNVFDYQAPRMAYAGNDSIFPRNKFFLDGAQRTNVDVNSARFTEPTSNLILAAELHYSERQGWRTVRREQGASGDGGVWKSVSHRPITPFYSLSSGQDVYDAANTSGRFTPFVYPDPTEDAGQIYADGSRSLDDQALLDGEYSLNAVSRFHGGKAHFVFVDGHVDLMSVQETIRRQLWGKRFYSISGDNRVSDEFVNGGARFEDIN